MLSRRATGGSTRGWTSAFPCWCFCPLYTVYRRQWTPEYQENDGVLDVELLARRAVRLGHLVTVARVPGAMHDVFASAEPVRTQAFDQVQRWLKAYAPAQRS
ncbi:hypothetical protein [Nesterenkonia pannonica]|uniref:hypothetical protein n=1 Tax=Nesterenkonia pannonica TaxID=1548602 RepID=UPI0021642E25|nr:hypothetical protein [Nesterenkonia pannonica]